MTDNQPKGPPPPPWPRPLGRHNSKEWRADAAVTIAAAICRNTHALVQRDAIADAALDIVDRIINQC